MIDLSGELAHHMALLPLLVLGGLWAYGGRRDPQWWWLALAFAVSWMADTFAHYTDPSIVGAIYPVFQASIVASVLLPQREVKLFALAMIVAGIIAVISEGLAPDRFLRTVAWGSIVIMVYTRPRNRLRSALLVYFGLSWLSWLGYTYAPGWPSWTVYQIARGLGIALFCWALWNPAPIPRVAIKPA